MFQLKSQTVYLFNEFDNIAVLRSEVSGCFNRSAITSSAVYIVNGEVSDVTHNPASFSSGYPPRSAYGACSSPTSNIPPPRPALSLRRKQVTFRKTIAVVSLSISNKPSTSKAAA